VSGNPATPGYIQWLNPWHQILPQLEMEPLYTATIRGVYAATGQYHTGGTLNAYDNSVAPIGTLNQYNRQVPVKSLLCPADDGLDKNGWARTQVGGWMGASYAWNWQLVGTPGSTAVVSIYSLPMLASKDGTSNTLLFAEKQATCFQAQVTVTASPAVAAKHGNLWAHHWSDNYTWQSVFACNASSRAVNNTNGFYLNWNQPPMIQPNIVTAVAGGAPNQCDNGRASTGHNVCLVCMADGSVKAISGDVSQYTWQAAILPTDGVPLGSDWGN